MKTGMARVPRSDTKTAVKFRQKDYEGKKITESEAKFSEGNVTGRTALKTLTGARWHEMEKVKDELRAMLPILSPVDVKKYYLPFHEVVILELEENGYHKSIDFLKELFDLDEEARKEAGPGTLTWKKPRLKNNKDALVRLKEGLSTVERAKNIGDSMSAVTEFLEMAMFFQAMTWQWWWVAERLYRNALANAESVEDDDQRTVTLIRYLYGRFLFEQLQDTAESLDHLKVALEASRQKTWNASRITGRKEESVFRECNVLLHKVLLTYAQQIDPGRPDVAVKACAEALARATDSGHHEYVANALHELGKSQLRSGDVKHALQNFSKLLAIARRIPDPERVCNAHMALALAYKLCELDDGANTEKHLRLFRQNATECGFTKLLAQAHYCTGEHFLSKRKPEIATFHLETSFNLYNELSLHDEANKARIIAGVSKGQKNIDQYIDLILHCSTVDPETTSTLRQWKDCRRIFWNGKKSHIEDSEILETSSSEIITDTANIV